MSQTTMEKELDFALEFRELLQKTQQSQTNSANLYALIEPELIKLLYAKNKKLAQIAQQNIEFYLAAHFNAADPELKTLVTALHQLTDHRLRYLTDPAKTLLTYWQQQGWTGANMALLTIPFILGVFFPPAGLVMLIYGMIDAGVATIDFLEKSNAYWLEEKRPESRSLTPEQITLFKTKHANIDLFLPQNNPIPNAIINNKLNTASYINYVLVFAIAVIGLGALLFPPIGIPALALMILAGITIISTGTQFGFTYQKQQLQLTEIIEAQNNSEELQRHHSLHHDSTAFISSHLPSDPHHLSAPVHPNATSIVHTTSATSAALNKKDEADEDEHEGQSPHF